MNNKIIARLTAHKADGSRLTVEVRADATFTQFYTYYQQQRRFAKKQFLRCSNRNDGLRAINAHRQEAGLAALQAGFKANRFANVTKVTIRIFNQRMYRQLLEAAPDVLGMTRTAPTAIDQSAKRLPTPRIPVAIPQGWLTIEKRMSILTKKVPA
jgi:hypothetical protein